LAASAPDVGFTEVASLRVRVRAWLYRILRQFPLLIPRPDRVNSFLSLAEHYGVLSHSGLSSSSSSSASPTSQSALSRFLLPAPGASLSEFAAGYLRAIAIPSTGQSFREGGSPLPLQISPPLVSGNSSTIENMPSFSNGGGTEAGIVRHGEQYHDHSRRPLSRH
jgi:hypothetical protein